ncbi:hypothetical protein QJS10_CPB15g00913 [Acorus calamus]|uniref:Uncharacterized protein n=1 Tax=Acorus calamus TaxID=4465 RepID=A0AAV9D980_ACOCL|nr:hypothetical protein QJS10_CPB15g00913 [Acorus calamus]
MGTYGQLILALEKDHRAEEAHKISVFVQFWKLFRDIESYDRRPTDKLIVQKVADAYELLGLPEDKKRILDKYDYLFNESSRLNFQISKTNSTTIVTVSFFPLPLLSCPLSSSISNIQASE